MSCPYVAKAIKIGTKNSRTEVRLCMAIPRERDNDPEEMPPAFVCFSEADFLDCYHYKVMRLRGEPPVEQPEEDSVNGLQPFEFNEEKGNKTVMLRPLDQETGKTRGKNLER